MASKEPAVGRNAVYLVRGRCRWAPGAITAPWRRKAGGRGAVPVFLSGTTRAMDGLCFLQMGTECFDDVNGAEEWSSIVTAELLGGPLVAAESPGGSTGSAVCQWIV